MKTRSPKNKFRAEIYFSKALPGIGSVTSVTANTINEIKSLAEIYVNQAKTQKVKITIFENLNNSPVFYWTK